VVALTRMCELFPNHADWMKWYSAVTLYSDYFQEAMAQFTQPYGMRPAVPTRLSAIPDTRA
jgi:hypothetical protein